LRFRGRQKIIDPKSRMIDPEVAIAQTICHQRKADKSRNSKRARFLVSRIGVIFGDVSRIGAHRSIVHIDDPAPLISEHRGSNQNHAAKNAKRRAQLCRDYRQTGGSRVTEKMEYRCGGVVIRRLQEGRLHRAQSNTAHELGRPVVIFFDPEALQLAIKRGPAQTQ